MEKIIKNKYFQKIFKFIFNYMNWMIILGGYYAFLMLFCIWPYGFGILTKVSFIFSSLAPMSILVLLKLLTIKFKSKWLFIIISIISTIYVFLYVCYALIGGMLIAMFSQYEDFKYDEYLSY